MNKKFDCLSNTSVKNIIKKISLTALSISMLTGCVSLRAEEPVETEPTVTETATPEENSSEVTEEMPEEVVAEETVEPDDVTVEKTEPETPAVTETENSDVQTENKEENSDVQTENKEENSEEVVKSDEEKQVSSEIDEKDKTDVSEVVDDAEEKNKSEETTEVNVDEDGIEIERAEAKPVIDETEAIEDDATVEHTGMNLYRAKDTADYVAAVASLPDDSETRLTVLTNNDLTTVVDYGSGVFYDGTYILVFNSVEDRNAAKEAIDAILTEGAKIGKDVKMSLSEGETPIPNTEETEVNSEEETIPETVEKVESETSEKVVPAETPTVEEEAATADGENEEKADEADEPVVIEVAPSKEVEDAANDGLTLQEVTKDNEDKKLVAVIDTGVKAGIASKSVNLTSDPDADSLGHGTEVATMIKDIAGDRAEILSIKAFNDDGTASMATMTAAVQYAIAADADFINISASIYDSEDTEPFKQAILEAIQNGIVVVASAGNNGDDVANYVPANIPEVDTVGAAIPLDGLGAFGAAKFSNYGAVDWWYVEDSTSLAAAHETAMLAAGIENEHVWSVDSTWTRFETVKYADGGAKEATDVLDVKPSEALFHLNEALPTHFGGEDFTADIDRKEWNSATRSYNSTFTVNGMPAVCTQPNVYIDYSGASYSLVDNSTSSSSTQTYYWNDLNYFANGGTETYHSASFANKYVKPYDPEQTYTFENVGGVNLTGDGYYATVDSVESGNISAVRAWIEGNSLKVAVDYNTDDLPDGIRVSVHSDKKEIGSATVTTITTCHSMTLSSPVGQDLSMGSTGCDVSQSSSATPTHIWTGDDVYLKIERSTPYVDKDDNDRSVTSHLGKAQGDATLAGTEYTIVNTRNNKVVAMFNSEDEGLPYKSLLNNYGTGSEVVNVDYLKYGDYKITETKAPVGYLLNKDWVFYFGVRDDGLVYDASLDQSGSNGGKVIEKVIRGGIEVTKYDTERFVSQADPENPNTPQGNGTLAGATYDIINRSADEVYVNNQWVPVGGVVLTLTTDENGYASTSADALPYGTYEIVETKAPEGYLLNGGWSVTIRIREDGRIYNSVGIANADYVANKNEDGTKSNHDYVYDNHKNGVITSDFMTDDIIRGGVKFKKIDLERQKDQEQGDATLEGAEISIYNNSTYSVMVHGQWYKPGEVVDRIYTDAKGNATTEDNALPYGDYYAIETKAPVGYLIDTEWRYDFTISEDKVIIDATESKIADQVIRGDVRVYKYDLELDESEAIGGSGHRSKDAHLNGIRFDIKNASLTSILIDSDEDGELDAEIKPGELVTSVYTYYNDDLMSYVAETTNKFLPYGTYTIQEIPTSESGNNTIKMNRNEIKDSSNDAYRFTDGEVRYFQIGDHSYGPVTLDTNLSDVDGLIVDYGSTGTPVYKTGITANVMNELTYTTWDYATGNAITNKVSFTAKNGDATNKVSNPMSDLQEANGTFFKKTGDAERDKTMIFKNQIKRNNLTFTKKDGYTNDPLESLWVLINNTTGERHVLYVGTDGEFSSTRYAHSQDTNKNDKFLALIDQGVEISLALKADNNGVGEVVTDAGNWFGLGEDGHMADVDDNLAMLPYGSYTLQEVATDTVQGKELARFEFRVEQDATIKPSGIDLGTILNYGITITSKATNVATGTNSGLADGTVITIEDTVWYNGVRNNGDYVLVGKLIDKETNLAIKDADGNEITSVTELTINSSEGEIKGQTFEVDTTNLGGTKVVVYEYLYTKEAYEAEQKAIAEESGGVLSALSNLIKK